MPKDIEAVVSAEMPEQITRYGRKGYDFNYDITLNEETGMYEYKAKRFDSYHDLQIWVCQEQVKALAELVL